jgi:O-antigen ligase
LIMTADNYSRSKKVFIVLLLVFFVQMVLTLSRGGMLSFVLFALIGFPFFFKTRQGRTKYLVTTIALVAIIWGLLLPALDDYTEGAILRRYEDDTTTNRLIFMNDELEAFYENPIIGIGPGIGKNYRAAAGSTNIQSHTEYTRILAEHGSIGALGMLLIMLCFVMMFYLARDAWRKGIVLGLAAWIFSYFSHSASRTVSFAFLGILAVLYAFSLVEDGEEQSSDQSVVEES